MALILVNNVFKSKVQVAWSFRCKELFLCKFGSIWLLENSGHVSAGPRGLLQTSFDYISINSSTILIVLIVLESS